MLFLRPKIAILALLILGLAMPSSGVGFFNPVKDIFSKLDGYRELQLRLEYENYKSGLANSEADQMMASAVKKIIEATNGDATIKARVDEALGGNNANNEEYWPEDDEQAYAHYVLFLRHLAQFSEKSPKLFNANGRFLTNLQIAYLLLKEDDKRFLRDRFLSRSATGRLKVNNIKRDLYALLTQEESLPSLEQIETFELELYESILIDDFLDNTVYVRKGESDEPTEEAGYDIFSECFQNDTCEEPVPEEEKKVEPLFPYLIKTPLNISEEDRKAYFNALFTSGLGSVITLFDDLLESQKEELLEKFTAKPIAERLDSFYSKKDILLVLLPSLEEKLKGLNEEDQRFEVQFEIEKKYLELESEENFKKFLNIREDIQKDLFRNQKNLVYMSLLAELSHQEQENFLKKPIEEKNQDLSIYMYSNADELSIAEKDWFKSLDREFQLEFIREKSKELEETAFIRRKDILENDVKIDFRITDFQGGSKTCFEKPIVVDENDPTKYKVEPVWRKYRINLGIVPLVNDEVRLDYLDNDQGWIFKNHYLIDSGERTGLTLDTLMQKVRYVSRHATRKARDKTREGYKSKPFLLEPYITMPLYALSMLNLPFSDRRIGEKFERTKFIASTTHREADESLSENVFKMDSHTLRPILEQFQETDPEMTYRLVLRMYVECPKGGKKDYKVFGRSMPLLYANHSPLKSTSDGYDGTEDMSNGSYKAAEGLNGSGENVHRDYATTISFEYQTSELKGRKIRKKLKETGYDEVLDSFNENEDTFAPQEFEYEKESLWQKLKGLWND